MGILLLMMLFTIVFSVLWYTVRHHCNLFSEFICPLASVFSLVVLILSFLMVVVSYISIPANTIKLDEEYKSLSYQMENNIYENEVSKKMLIDQIKEWNSDLRQYTYYHNSFWTNVFFPVDYNGYEYIEIEEINNVR